jgi:hypothetical protein
MLLEPMDDGEQTLTVLCERCTKQISQAIWLGAYDLYVAHRRVALFCTLALPFKPAVRG